MLNSGFNHYFPYSLLPDHFIGMFLFYIFTIILLPLSAASAICEPGRIENMSLTEQAIFVSTRLLKNGSSDIYIGLRLLTTSIELEYLADSLLRNAIVDAMDSLNTYTFISQINATIYPYFKALLYSFNTRFSLGSTLSTNAYSVSLLGYKLTGWKFSGLHLAYTKSVNHKAIIHSHNILM